MRKIVAGLAMTINGLVEDPSGADGWLLPSDDMDAIIQEGLDRADAILLGRRTYLEFAGLWPSMGDGFPMAAFMNNTPKYVASGTLAALEWGPATLLAGPLRESVAQLKEEPGRDILVPGSPALVSGLLVEGLLDELGLMVHPTAVGTGTRLFEQAGARRGLELVGASVLSTGVVSMTYRPAGPA